jgi:actin-like ATPase involved in cell morphogenesis
MAKFSRSSFFSSDIGIDLGTANTLVYVRGRGIVINEPSVVAVNDKTGQVVAVGADAKAMLGKTPPHIRAVRPLSHGVISDFEVTEELFAYLINKAQGGRASIFGPRVVIGVPTGVTNVESRAVRDAALTAARAKYLLLMSRSRARSEPSSRSMMRGHHGARYRRRHDRHRRDLARWHCRLAQLAGRGRSLEREHYRICAQRV